MREGGELTTKDEKGAKGEDGQRWTLAVSLIAVDYDYDKNYADGPDRNMVTGSRSYSNLWQAWTRKGH